MLVACGAAASGFREVFARQELQVHRKTDIFVASVKAFEPAIQITFIVVLSLRCVVNGQGSIELFSVRCRLSQKYPFASR
jgi:hypothetical protein